MSSQQLSSVLPPKSSQEENASCLDHRVETPSATGLYLDGENGEVTDSKERRSIEAVQKLHYKLQMQKSHFENKISNMKVQIKELESEVKVYVANLAEKSKSLRHLEAVSEARNITISVFEKQTTEVMRFMREVDPDLQHSIDRLMEYQKQIAEDPPLVHKLPTARDLAIEYKRKRLENMQRRSSLEKSAFGQLHALPAKKSRKPSIAPDTMFVKPAHSTTASAESPPDQSSVKEKKDDEGVHRVQKGLGLTSPKSMSTSRSQVAGTSLWSPRNHGGHKHRQLEAERGMTKDMPFTTSEPTLGELQDEGSLAAQISPKASFRVIVPDSKQADLHRDKGAKTLSVNPTKSFQGRRHSQSVATMHLEAFMDYSEMEEVNRAREQLKATQLEHQRELTEAESEKTTLKTRLRAAESKLSEMKIRESALRQDFEKLVARTLSAGPVSQIVPIGNNLPSSGKLGGLSGPQTARTFGQARGFEMPQLNTRGGKAVAKQGSNTLETLNTPRLPEISTKLKARRQNPGEASVSPPSRSLRNDIAEDCVTVPQESISLVPTKHGVIPKRKMKEKEITVTEDSSFVAVVSPPDSAQSPTRPAEDECVEVKASVSIISLDKRPISLVDEQDDPQDGIPCEDMTEQTEALSEVSIPKALPTAPWVPSSPAHVDQTRTAPAFRILLSCYVHDLCNLVRIIQPAQDTLFKESRDLQDYMLSLWNGETNVSCPTANVDLNILNLQEIIPSFSNNPVVKQLGKLSEKTNPTDQWTEEVELLILSWKSLTGSLQQIIAHFQQQIGLWRKTQLTMWNKNRGLPRNLVKPPSLKRQKQTTGERGASEREI